MLSISCFACLCRANLLFFSQSFAKDGREAFKAPVSLQAKTAL